MCLTLYVEIYQQNGSSDELTRIGICPKGHINCLKFRGISTE